MTRIVHISDTHFGTDIAAVRDALARAIAAHKPDVVVLSGDITQRARPSQFAAARRFCDVLGVPVLAVPGNHDLPLYNAAARFLRPYGNYKRYFGAREWVATHGNVTLAGFDATHPLRHTRGRLCPDHVDQVLGRIRDATPDANIIVVVHQPVMVAWPEDTPEALIDAAKTCAVFARHSITAVLSGHVHVPMLAHARAGFADLPHDFLHSGAGTAISWRTRPCAPNSFTVLDVAANGVISGRIYIFDAAQQNFIPA